jgi:hypothetical protein
MATRTLDMATLYPEVNEAVDKYLSEVIHEGFSRPFGGIDRFETDSAFPRIVHVIPKNLTEEDISDNDASFDEGLLRLGVSKRLILRLPYWAYTK